MISLKIYNYLAESDSLVNVYRSAVNKGLMKRMPNSLSIAKEAADIVRNTVPNYAYVSSFLQD